MVNQLLETSHPASSSALRLRASARASVFHLPHPLPSSVSCNPFACRSLALSEAEGFTKNWCEGNSPLLVPIPYSLSPFSSEPRGPYSRILG
jgi:hypothetical protein